METIATTAAAAIATVPAPPRSDVLGTHTCCPPFAAMLLEEQACQSASQVVIKNFSCQLLSSFHVVLVASRHATGMQCRIVGCHHSQQDQPAATAADVLGTVGIDSKEARQSCWFSFVEITWS